MSHYPVALCRFRRTFPRGFPVCGALRPFRDFLLYAGSCYGIIYGLLPAVFECGNIGLQGTRIAGYAFFGKVVRHVEKVAVSRSFLRSPEQCPLIALVESAAYFPLFGGILRQPVPQGGVLFLRPGVDFPGGFVGYFPFGIGEAGA